MSQIHLVIMYDTEDGTTSVDWETTQARFCEENIFRPEEESLDFCTEEEDKIIEELIPQLDHLFEDFRLDI